MESVQSEVFEWHGACNVAIVTKTIKATLRNENGQFEANIELIGWEKAPLELVLNLENFAPAYNLECADIGQGRAHYEKKVEQ